MSDAVILFDETGTPTLRGRREGRYFTGVSISYALNDEPAIFEQSGEDFSLLCRVPKKRSDHNIESISRGASRFGSIDLPTKIVTIDLENAELKDILPRYEEFGNSTRKLHRHKGKRAHSHILHSEVFNHAVLNMIFDIATHFDRMCRFEVFYDNWEYPKCDKHIVKELTPESMQQRTNELLHERGIYKTIEVESFETLSEDSARKRFIDFVTTLMTFDNTERPSRDNVLRRFPSLLRCGSLEFEDITEETCSIFVELMNGSSHG